MEVVNLEIGLIRRRRIIPMAHIEDVFFNIISHYKPRSSSHSKPLTLANGVKPKAFVLANLLARLKLNDVSRLLAEVSPDIFIIVYLP